MEQPKRLTSERIQSSRERREKKVSVHSHLHLARLSFSPSQQAAVVCRFVAAVVVVWLEIVKFIRLQLKLQRRGQNKANRAGQEFA